MSNEPTVNLELITKPSIGKDGTYVIEGIPKRIMNSFKERAKDILPEKGEKAWSALLCEVITSHLETSETTSYIMTEIPIDYLKNMEELANQMNLSVDNIFAGVIKSAGNNSLHMLNLHFPPEMGHTGWRCMVILGISNEAWQKWAEYSNKMGTTPEELYGHILESAYTGNMETKPDLGKTDTETSELIEKLSKLSPDEIDEMIKGVQSQVEQAQAQVENNESGNGRDMSDWDLVGNEGI